MAMTEHQEMTIGKTSRLTLGLVITLCGLITLGSTGMVSGALIYASNRAEDREENRNGRYEILQAIQDVKDGQLAYRTLNDNRVGRVEGAAARSSKDRWPASVMKIWVLESQKAGSMVDPDPIIDRYLKD